MTNQSIHYKRNTEKFFFFFLDESYCYSFRINSSSEEGGLPRVDIFLTLTGQLQLTVIFIDVSVNVKHSKKNETGATKQASTSSKYNYSCI